MIDATPTWSIVASNWKTILSSLVGVFVVSRIINYQNGLKQVRGLPTLATPGTNMQMPGVLWNGFALGGGLTMHWRLRHVLYRWFQHSEIIAFVPYLFGQPEIYTNNIDVARQVAVGGHKCSFIKPEISSRLLLMWGMNLFSADKETWRKHRRVVGPAFSNQLYDTVLAKSVDIYNDMVASEEWSSKSRIEIPSLQEITFKFALLVVGICGFGFSFTWKDPPAPEGKEMSVQEALNIVGRDNLFHSTLPKWVFRLPFKRLRQSYVARSMLNKFMHEQVQSRKMAAKTGEIDETNAFSMLVKANEELDGKYSLDDDELIGNTFVLLFAGHETTAHTLAATLGLLAAHQDIQKEAYEQIVEVLGAGAPQSVAELFSLDKALGSLFESLRLFPAAHIMIREAWEDTTLIIPTNPTGPETRSHPVPKGTRINVDMVGVQYNPRYFPNPSEFQPSRWKDISPDSEQFTAFSIGTRACLGRRFAIIESLTFLALILRDYKIEPRLEINPESGKEESVEEWQKRVLDAKILITLGVNPVSLVLKKRDT